MPFRFGGDAVHVYLTINMSFSYGSTTDDNGGKLYDVKGESAAVSGGQAVTDVTPNCTVTTKQ